jgi:hypothetical protein
MTGEFVCLKKSSKTNLPLLDHEVRARYKLSSLLCKSIKYQ